MIEYTQAGYPGVTINLPEKQLYTTQQNNLSSHLEKLHHGTTPCNNVSQAPQVSFLSYQRWAHLRQVVKLWWQPVTPSSPGHTSLGNVD